MNNKLKEESSSFDKQINERVRNGHIPDLRRSGRCEYFYNNVWRDQEYANLYFGEVVKKYISAIEKNLNLKKDKIRVLEVGCGPGHICLELSRNGFNVTGIDISKECIRIAEETAANDPWKGKRRKLKYDVKTFEEIKGKFDVILFTAALHHFPSSEKTVKHAYDILSDHGLIIVDEPIRDQVSKRNAVVTLLIRGLLSGTGSYYNAMKIPQDNDSAQKALEDIYLEERYEQKDGSKVQSINDNSSQFSSMYGALEKYFVKLEFEKKYALFHQIIGGIRLKSIEKERELAKFIKVMDDLLCENQSIDPTNFFYAGKRKK